MVLKEDAMASRKTASADWRSPSSTRDSWEGSDWEKFTGSTASQYLTGHRSVLRALAGGLVPQVIGSRQRM